MTKHITPRPAATITLVRDAGEDFEVLMLQRNLNSGFVAGAYVFPGGAVDEADHAPELHALCEGLTDAAASQHLSLERGGLAYWIASIRETFEEAGLLLACDSSGELVALDDEALVKRYVEHRHALNAGSETMIGMCEKEGLRLAAGRLTYFSHWITPAGAPRRYDTRFFVAPAPARQTPLHDDQETIAHLWISPREALERHQRKELILRSPTIATLKLFARARSSAELIATLAAQSEIPAMRPVIRKDGRRLMPGDPGYEEALNQDPGTWK